MTRHILIVNGHPDSTHSHLCSALIDAYVAGAAAAQHELRRVDVAELNFGWLRSKQEFEHTPPPSDIAKAQESLRWADHLVLVYPLWMGTMPALLKAFLEQLLRPDFVRATGNPRAPHRSLRGKSARIVLTMGMPAFIYRWYFGAHGLKALRRSVLRLCGFAPISDTLVGNVEASAGASRQRALQRMHTLGRAGR